MLIPSMSSVPWMLYNTCMDTVPNTTNMRLIFPKSHLHLEISKSDPIGLHKVRECNPDCKNEIVSPNFFRQKIQYNPAAQVRSS